MTHEPTPEINPDPARGGDDAAASLFEAAAHVQEAVLAMVAAARVALDVVERLAKDPGPLIEAAGRAAEAGREAAMAWSPDSTGTGASAGPADEAAPRAEDVEEGAAGGARPGPTRRPRVEHIRVEPVDE